MKGITKIIITFFCLLIFAAICFSFYIYIQNDDKVAILGYHGILPRELNTSGDTLITDSEKFEQQLKTLKNLGYHTMTLDEFYCWKQGTCKKKHKSVLITFDDGYQNNYDYAFELLKKYDMNAVVFCVGTHIKSENPIFMNLDTINKSYKEYPNIEFASHSYDLHHRNDRSYEAVIQDAEKMQSLINSSYYAYPFGEHSTEYIEALKKKNYKLAFTFGPDKEHRKASLNDDDYKIPRLNVSNDMSLMKFILRISLPL